MSKKIRLHGIKEGTSDIKPFQVTLEKGTLETTAKGRVRLGLSRDIGEPVDLPDMQPDDIACVEYSNGFKLWIRVDDLYHEHGVQRSRGGVDDDADVWEIDPQLRGKEADRGLATLAIEALEFFGVDLKEIAADALCEWFEAKQLHNETPGLYSCSLENNAFTLKEKVEDISLPNENQPILLFIHGTGSSTAGSFGGLWKEEEAEKKENTKVLEEVRRALADKYQHSCYALEHCTLTVSPIDNALEIAKALPANAELHVVTHSRGGLVGELLCLGQRDKSPDPLQADLLNSLFDTKKDHTLGGLLGLPWDYHLPNGKGYDDQKRQLGTLLETLDKKHIKVTRFVRVACPALGTTLVSGRLDRWLSLIQYLSPCNDVVNFLLGVLKERTDPRSLPGLEAMMPGSALIKLLNYPDLSVTADLSVIAGDIEGDSKWAKLKLQLADWFFDSLHDLVVNSPSMYGGIRRKEGLARFFFHQCKDENKEWEDVSHFNYFKNKTTVTKLKDGLLRADNDLADYKSLSAPKRAELTSRLPANRSVLRKSKPLAILLHGIMASHLMHNNERIWQDYSALSKGKLSDLAINMPGVEPQELIDEYYADFISYLNSSHQVKPFLYDWRLSLMDSAKKLAELMDNRLPACEATGQPLRLIAHSMGGLVVRVMFALYPSLWKRFQALHGSRFMMLGTPNAGSYEAVRWLTGWNPTLGQLSWLDSKNDSTELVKIVNRYPGLLELLPSNDGRNYTSPDFWKQLCAGGDADWPLPPAEQLQNLRETWRLIHSSPVDPERMVYVAGWAPETVCGFDTVPSMPGTKKLPPLRFYATKKGDGTVPWRLGQLPELKTWYVEGAIHNQLLAYTPAFPAYLDLLQLGTTTRLSQDEPLLSRSANATEERSIMRSVLPDSIPTEADLSRLMFGAGRPFKPSEQRHLPKVKVSIHHGDLAYAKYPVCVGHYFGDAIISNTETELDRTLDYALSKRIRFGLYPGEQDSHEIFLHNDKNARPNGAIVIGLGRVGELSPGLLAHSIEHALRAYALKINEWPDDRFGARGTLRSAKVSFLLIGTGFGGISIRDSIESILNAVKSTNNRLLETQFDDKVVFDEIEILEIHLDEAIKAAKAMEQMLQDDESLQLHFDWQDDHTVQSDSGGLQRTQFDTDVNRWQHLEIVYDKKYQLLRFIALTDRARAEETLVSGQMQLADQFIAEMISSTRNTKQIARTLFEMLLPNPLKELAPNHYDVVLILDAVSARYPWELLDDRWGSAKPLAVQAGMLRQLKTRQFRAKPLHSSEKKAFVIGNPVIPVGPEGVIFPDLPAAAEEAEAVMELLAGKGYDVNRALTDRRPSGHSAQDILAGLHGDGYRILHLAGHGVHEFAIEDHFLGTESCRACGQNLVQDSKRVSGMVIGNNIFLTPGDVEQMRWVPELVFINCCHLGNTEDHYPPEAKRYNELAANLGTQFIDMGVKAVIAAGWAVNDAAAKAFAELFYQSMLSGNPFGIAVRSARQFIHEQFPNVNTWGAYQCYGDPYFRLVVTDDGVNKQQQPQLPAYHARAEWAMDLENLISRIRGNKHAEENNQQWQEQLESCSKRVPIKQRESWQAQADVAVALGSVYGELKEYDKAITYLDKASAAATSSNAPINTLEQRVYYQIKRALQFHPIANVAEKDAYKKELVEAIYALEKLNAIAATKRFSLLGNAYKRLAWLQQSNKAEITNALKKMRDNYHRALIKNAQGETIDALTHWITANIVLSWFDKNDQTSKNKEKRVIDPKHWNAINEPERLLMKALEKAILTPEEKDVLTSEERENIIKSYQSAAAQHDVNRKDKAALREYFEFLIFMSGQAEKRPIQKALQTILRELINDNPVKKSP